jgi:hypothetical protein
MAPAKRLTGPATTTTTTGASTLLHNNCDEEEKANRKANITNFFTNLLYTLMSLQYFSKFLGGSRVMGGVMKYKHG